MREAIKISVLGGSGVYTPGLILSLLDNIDYLPRINLVLCGRTEEKLNRIYEVASSIVKNHRERINIVATTNFESGIEGSDIVINQIRVGGFHARQKDEEFAREIGVVEEETMGIIGLANALRTIPVVLKYASLVEKYAPDAYFLNFTNPASMVIRSLNNKTRLKVFGVCDLPEVITHRISAILNISRENLYFKYVGLNHLGWIIDVLKNGNSLMAGVIEKADRFDDLGIRGDFIRFCNAVPVPFLKFYYDPDEQIKKSKDKSITRGKELLLLEDELINSYSKDEVKNSREKIKELLFNKRKPVWYEYSVVPAIVSLFGNKHSTHIIMHRNNGVLNSLKDDDIVEANAYMDDNGIKMIKDGELPQFAEGLVKSVATYERFCVNAIFDPTDSNLIKALLAHPLVPSYGIAKKSLNYLRKQG